MCVVVLALAADPRWRLVVAANRDEFHNRAAAPLARWDGAPELIAGRDLLSGGTWLGVSEAGRLAVVTNVAGHPRGADAPSRGALVADFLHDERLPADAELGRYGGFSLLTVGAAASFRTNQPAPAHRALLPGLHGISNGPLDPPASRTRTLTSMLGDWLADDRPLAALLDLLLDESPATTGERPVFIRDAVYGTRCSTVVAINAAGEGTIIERRYDPAGNATGETAVAFRWPPQR